MKEEIQALYRKESFDPGDRTLLQAFLDQLDAGKIRSAQRVEGSWRANVWVKEGILAGFRMGVLSDQSIDGRFRFFDKDTFPLKVMGLESGIRIVPGGSSIRRGAYVASGVTCMPPMYINVGAYVGTGTMIDSHALVGSCAQIGERVHLSAAAQVGGVLEPVGALPVVIEDDVLVGGNCGVYEGTVVRSGAILAAGVILTRGTSVYDLVRGTVYRSSAERPLEIPENAVVVAGSRPAKGSFAEEMEIALYCPVIVKYRDEKTSKSIQLEGDLRSGR